MRWYVVNVYAGFEQKIADAIRSIQINMPNLERFQQLQQSFAELHRFKLPMLDTTALKKLHQTIEQINRPTKEITALNESIDLMRVIRNKAAHDLRPDREYAPSRPAYTLDEEDDDA